MSIFHVLIIFLMASNAAMAEPVVIFDSGRTVSTVDYRKMLTDSQTPNFGESWFLNTMPSNADPARPETWFPIETKKMTSGIVEDKEVYFSQLVSPFCIIGTDSLSIEWVKKNQSYLQQMKARCWLVQANNIEEVRVLGKILKNVSITPANGDAIAQYFKITHYPVLITSRYLSQ